ncbi:MAG: NAD-dependent epimerase [Bacteroidota bacterium]
MSKILVTGTAGFIGFHLAEKLLKQGFEVVGLDAINDYYDVRLKYARLTFSGINENEIAQNKFALSSKYPNYRFIKMNLEDKQEINNLFETEKFDYVVNLAAQAGVRYSLTNPDAYVQSNIVGFLNILEASRVNNIKHLLYASSSSVYGLNSEQPFSTSHNVDHPLSMYAVSKKSNELMAHTYSYVYGLPTTGLRFFTVYGPWGRPDMALFIFAKAIMEDKPVEIFNYGNMERDFTYVDDIVEAISRLVNKTPIANEEWDKKNPSPATSSAPYQIFNIGNNSPVKLTQFIDAIELNLGKKALRELKPMHKCDVSSTFADVSDLYKLIDFKPSTSVNDGIKSFVDWYKKYYN